MNKRLFIPIALLAVLGFVIPQANVATGAAAGQADEITVQSVQVNAQDVQAEVCIPLPSQAAWEPFASLTVDGQRFTNTVVALLDAKNPDIMETARRCYRFTFQVGTGRVQSATATLKLEKLSREVDGGLLTPQGETAARTRLQKEYPQLDFKVVFVNETGGGGADIQVLSLPENMSEEQAIMLIQQASMEEVAGNWQQEISLH